MRRKNGDGLVRNEELVLVATLNLHTAGEQSYHGYRLNQYLDEHSSRLVPSTLYRILKRLQEREYMTSHWEQNPDTDQWRCMFELTGEGVKAAQEVAVKPSSQAFPIAWSN